jgi:dipeptidyl aminopeptidase/acylaminoacyl peptidase
MRRLAGGDIGHRRAQGVLADPGRKVGEHGGGMGPGRDLFIRREHAIEDGADVVGDRCAQFGQRPVDRGQPRLELFEHGGERRRRGVAVAEMLLETAGEFLMRRTRVVPQWNFDMSTYAFAGARRIACVYTKAGLGHLATLDLASGSLQAIETGFTAFGSLCADGDSVVFRGGASDRPTSIAALDLRSGQYRILKQAADLLDHAELRIANYIAKVEPVEFPTTGGNTAFGLFYPPRNRDYAGSPDERPPLLVKCHGGPTSSASSTLNLGTQFWTSRGIAVLDVNYGGSTGFGREYRKRLKLNWGIVDVDDCVNGAKFLAQQGLVDFRRVVISGGSAGGYTTLAALAFRDFFVSVMVAPPAISAADPG